MRIICLLFTILFLSLTSHSQSSKKNYDLGLAHLEVHEYHLAIERFKKSWDSRQETKTAKKIIWSYVQLRNYKEALIWQNKIINDLYSEGDKELLFRTLMAEEQYRKASHYLIKFQNDSNQTWLSEIKQKLDTIAQWKTETSGEIEELSFLNTSESEISPFYIKEELIFSSNREATRIRKKDHATGLPFHDFYIASGKENQFTKPHNFSLIINSTGHESSLCLSSDAQDIYFTRISLNQNDNQVTHKMKLYRSKKENGSWLKPKAFALNDSLYSFGQPFLSKDGQLFFFASDMPGGYGGSDLYVSKKIDSISWTFPENLGENVNTPDNEMNPFCDENRTLYFSSNGHFSIGGYDLFKSELDGEEWGVSNNLKFPINSPADELSIFWVNNKQAYICSNRSNGSGLEDIYYFKKY